jgi:hypothetical protein
MMQSYDPAASEILKMHICDNWNVRDNSMEKMMAAITPKSKPRHTHNIVLSPEMHLGYPTRMSLK